MKRSQRPTSNIPGIAPLMGDRSNWGGFASAIRRIGAGLILEVFLLISGISSRDRFIGQTLHQGLGLGSERYRLRAAVPR